MDEKKLMELAERYQRKVDTALQNYQETGMTRYDTALQNNEDMADALRMAASAKADHDKLIYLRGALSQLAWKKQTALLKTRSRSRCRRYSENYWPWPVCRALSVTKEEVASQTSAA